MERCCMKDCDSHKHIGEKSISYFPFPVHDELLLKKWLAQINLPNWKPGASHRICSIHFHGDAIDNHPNRKKPFLKPTAIPTIFPSQATISVKTTNTDSKDSLRIPANVQNSLPIQAINVISNGNSDMSVLRSMPIILIPSCISAQNPVQFSLQNAMQIAGQFPTHDHSSSKNAAMTTIPTMALLNLMQMEMKKESPQASETFPTELQILQPKLRMILPKPEYFPIQRVASSFVVKNTQEALSTPMPEFNVLPQTVKSEKNDSVIAAPPRYPDNRRPVLRISINKQRNSETPEKSSRTPNENTIIISSDESEKDECADRTSTSGKEITIENSATNKTVTFRLDPETGEIVATTRKMNNSLDSRTARPERKVDDTHGRPSAAKLRQLYTKSQSECNALRKRLKVLRQLHKEEQEEIEKLQAHLAEIGVKVKETCCKDTSELRGKKRKEARYGVQSTDDDYKKMIQEVKQIKDIRKRSCLSTTSNNLLEVKSQKYLSKQTVNNGNPELLENNEDNLLKIRKSRNGAIIGEINECNGTIRTMNENCIDLISDSESDDIIFREESLEAEFSMD